jgi:hypothetical protein
MLLDGEYVAWFRTSRGSETGRAFLKDGKVSGSGAIISYSGSYVVDGDGSFTMKLSSRRHLAGHECLMGADEVELTLAGGLKRGGFAACTGSVDTSPGVNIDVTLFPVRADEVKQPTVYTAADFRLERLPEVKTR